MPTIKKLPDSYLPEFCQRQVSLIISRVRLCAILFIVTFTAGSIINNYVLHLKVTPQLLLALVITLCVSIAMLLLSKKVTTLPAAKLSAAAIMILALVVMTGYYISLKEAPFNVAMTYLFMFFGFSLIFPWFPREVVGVLLLHATGFSVFLVSVPRYIHKSSTMLTEVQDYLQGFVIMFLGFWMCLIISKREREREIENFVLLKEVKSKNKQMQQELELATHVHNRLVPHSVSTNLADIAVTYLPMNYVGGDYTNFHFIDKNKLIFIICDVTGHGVSAALLVNAFNAEFGRLAKEGKEPGALLKELDRFIIEDFAETNMFLSAFCGLLDYRSRKFTYSSYGHPPQYIYRAAASEIKRVHAQTSFLGLPVKDENIYQSEMPFYEGDQLLLFTDGVVETRNAEGKEYGDERLEGFIKEKQNIPVEMFNKELMDELYSFAAASKELKDDVLILNIRVR